LSSGRQDDAYLITICQQEEFAPGQLGAIRVGVDRKNRQQLEGRPRLHPGVYGIVEVCSFPEKRADSTDGFWLDIARVPRYYVCMVRSFNNLRRKMFLTVSIRRQLETYAHKYYGK